MRRDSPSCARSQKQYPLHQGRDGILASPSETSSWRQRDYFQSPLRNSRRLPQHHCPSSPSCIESKDSRDVRAAPQESFPDDFPVDQQGEQLKDRSLALSRRIKGRLSVSLSKGAVDEVAGEGEGEGDSTDTGKGYPFLLPPPALTLQQTKDNSHAKLDLLLTEVRRIHGRLDSIVCRLAALEEAGQEELSRGAGTTRVTTDRVDAILESKEGLH